MKDGEICPKCFRTSCGHTRTTVLASVSPLVPGTTFAEGQDDINPTKGLTRTFTGKTVNPMYLTPKDIDIRDIAHALSRICRFGGHFAGFCSVAEHSVNVSKHVPAHLALDGLLHDAAEAYLGDMIRPLKMLPAMKAFRDALENAERVIAEFFGIYPFMLAHIKEADNFALVLEISSFTDREAGLLPDDAELLFMSRFVELTQP